MAVNFNKKPRVAVLGCSHTDSHIPWDISLPHPPSRRTWAVQLSEQFPAIQIDCYARAGHGHDYQELCLKHIITQQCYDAVIIQLTTEHRGTVPLRTLDDEARFVSVRWPGKCFLQYNLMSPKIVYSIGYMRAENTYTDDEWNTPIKDLWENHIIGNNYNSFVTKTYCDMLPYYAQLQPNLMWFQWTPFSWQQDDQKGAVQNIHDQHCSAHDWAENELNYIDSDRYTLKNDDHLNDEGNARLLNDYILSSKIGAVLNQLK